MSVSAVVRYYCLGDEIAAMTDKSARHRITEPVEVSVKDARRAAKGELTLEQNGFQLEEFSSRVQNWHDVQELQRIFYPEVEGLLREVTGAARSHAFFHLVRTEHTKDAVRGYAQFAHADYTDEIAERVHHLMTTQMGITEHDRLNWDWAIYNFWCPIERPVFQNPLCVLDWKTIRAEDKVTVKFPNAPTTGSTRGSAKAAMHQLRKGDPGQHQWYYFSRMCPGEALLFKACDSRIPEGLMTGAAKHTFHTSIWDPEAPGNAPGRRSAEIRILCVFPRAGSFASKL